MVPEANDELFLPNMPRSPTFLNCCVRNRKWLFKYQKGFLHKKIIIIDGDAGIRLEPLIWICVVFI